MFSNGSLFVQCKSQQVFVWADGGELATFPKGWNLLCHGTRPMFIFKLYWMLMLAQWENLLFKAIFKGWAEGGSFGLRLLQTIVLSHKILYRGKPGNPPWKIPWTSLNHHTYSTGHYCPTAALYYTTIFCSVDLYQLFICSSIDVFSNIQMRLCFFKAPLKIIQSPVKLADDTVQSKA